MAAVPRKRRPGRPSKFTPKTRERILEAVRGGHYIETAARLGGVSYATLREWLRNGEEGAAAFVPFYEQYEEALAQAEDKLLRLVVNAAPLDWRAAMTVLERRHPDRWGRRQPQVDDGEGRVERFQIQLPEDYPVIPHARERLKALIERRAQELANDPHNFRGVSDDALRNFLSAYETLKAEQNAENATLVAQLQELLE